MPALGVTETDCEKQVIAASYRQLVVVDSRGAERKKRFCFVQQVINFGDGHEISECL